MTRETVLARARTRGEVTYAGHHWMIEFTTHEDTAGLVRYEDRKGYPNDVRISVVGVPFTELT